MALKNFNPVTPSLRGTVLVDRSELWKGKPVKGLTEGKHSSGGRNNHGRTPSGSAGGGHKQSYRIVDFKRAQVRRAGDGRAAGVRPEPHGLDRAAEVPGRRAAYIIAPQRLKAGDTVVSGSKGADIKPGQRDAAGARSRSAPSSTASR
jgi:large subunit ribosomal protein L2